MGRTISGIGTRRWRSAFAATWIAVVPAPAHARVVLDGTLHPAQSGVTVPSATDAAGSPATYLIEESQGRRARFVPESSLLNTAFQARAGDSQPRSKAVAVNRE